MLAVASARSNTEGCVEVVALYAMPIPLLGQRLGGRWEGYLVRVFDGRHTRHSVCTPRGGRRVWVQAETSTRQHAHVDRPVNHRSRVCPLLQH